ncbi:Hypothetical Protein FCC1311_118372, partial [Hondaea fermentalgiana]
MDVRSFLWLVLVRGAARVRWPSSPGSARVATSKSSGVLGEAGAAEALLLRGADFRLLDDELVEPDAVDVEAIADDMAAAA